MAIQEPGAPFFVPCLKCATPTHHRVLESVERSGGDEEECYFWESDYQIVECLGCKTVSFRQLNRNSEDITCNDRGEVGYDIGEQLYPVREMRRRIDGDYYLPDDVRRIYLETQRALVSDLRVLAGVGIRAIVEAVCKQMNATGGDLEKRIDSLVAKGLLTSSGAEVLHQLRSLGNKAAHEVKPHSAKQLSLAMDVVEHLLQGAYIIPEQTRLTLGEGA